MLSTLFLKNQHSLIHGRKICMSSLIYVVKLQQGYHIHALYWIIPASESEFYLLTKVLFIVKNEAWADTPLKHDKNGMTLVLVDHKFQ